MPGQALAPLPAAYASGSELKPAPNKSELPISNPLLELYAVTDMSRVALVHLNTHTDERGRLTAVEGDSEIPFPIRRIFYVYNVQPDDERGGHAHPNTEQFLIAMAGSLDIDVMAPNTTKTFHLDDPSLGLYVPEMLWVRLYNFTPDAVCFAAANTHYAEEDVIREWEEYRRQAPKWKRAAG